MLRVEFQKVTKKYACQNGRSICAINQLSLEVRAGEFFVLIGPSGCGKSTFLRLIAGLESPDEGEILLDGVPARSVEPKDRDIAMVFQSHALFPHLNARENISFGLRLRRLPRSEIEKRVQKVAGLLEMDHLLERKPQTLSGGECQRVALGRALVRQARVLLLDEPFSALDAPNRAQMRKIVKKVREDLNLTVVYVTHDQTEALTMADRVALLREGILEQVGVPSELLSAPSSEFVSSFFKP